MSLELSVNSVEQSIQDGSPIIHIFGRDSKNALRRVDVTGFQPYFYLSVDAVDDMVRVPDEITSIDDVNEYRTIKGERVYRIYYDNPRFSRDLRDRFGGFEADIPYQNRFLIDSGIIEGVTVDTTDAVDVGGVLTVNYHRVAPCKVDYGARTCIIDIECASPDERFPEAETDPINCITCWDSFTDVYSTFYLNSSDGKQIRDTDVDSLNPLESGCFDRKMHRVYVYNDEISMLRGFVEYIQAIDPDILTGWNYTAFDMPYILTRMITLGMQPMALSRVPGWMGRDNERVRGRSIFDLLNGYKKLQSGQKPSYRLDAIAEEELGERKVRYSGTIHDLWVSDPMKLIEYNFKDVQLCVGIDRKCAIVEFFRGISRYVGCSLEQTVNTSQVVDMYILRRGHGKFVFPSRNSNAVGQEFQGATVLSPSKGVRHFVCVFDLKSLYPMIMMTLNASPETKDPNGEIKAPNGIRFKKSPDGLTRSLMADLLRERDHLKAERNKYSPDSNEYKLLDAQQSVVKVIMNSYYGVSGYPRFRLYDRDFGAAVTSTGREIIQYVKKVIESMGYEVIYGDTDSCMAVIDGGSIEETIRLAKIVEAKLNASFDDFAKNVLNADQHFFSIKFEKLYETFFQTGKKKRYAGRLVWKEGKSLNELNVSGFETKRSDTSVIGKTLQEKVLTMIVDDVDHGEIKMYLRDMVRKFRRGEFSLEEFGIPGGISKPLDRYENPDAHIRGAHYANRYFGTKFGAGSKPRRVYIKYVNGGYPSIDVVCFEYAEQVPVNFVVDLEKMLNHTFRPVVRIIEALGWTWNDIDPTVTTLDMYGVTTSPSTPCVEGEEDEDEEDEDEGGCEEFDDESDF